MTPPLLGRFPNFYRRQFSMACLRLCHSPLFHIFLLSKFLWSPKTIFIMLKCNKTYKGNFEKYKGKIRQQDISFFGPKHNILGNLRWLATFLRSLCFFWHSYRLIYLLCKSEHHVCQICHKWHIRHIWHKWHLTFDMTCQKKR